ncbi:MAG: cytochrome P450 [Dehalococcoidia bacterium]
MAETATTEPTAPGPLGDGFDVPIFQGDPFPLFKMLRANSPVVKIGERFWGVAKYDDVLRVLRDPETFSSRVSAADERGEPRPPTILFDDPPVHTRMRGLLTKAFTPRMVELQRGFIQQNCDELIDAMLRKEEPDYVAGFSYPLPVGVIAKMLGVGDGDLATFKRWSDAIIESIGTTLFDPDNADMESINTEFDTYFKGYIERLREHPQDNLLSALVHAESEEEGRLSLEDLLVVSRVLLVAGNETTTGLLFNMARVFADLPEVLDQLRANLDLVPSFIEEALRYYPPFPATIRRTTRDVELRGVTIPKGDRLLALLGSANRDEEAFERADEFIIDREPNRHLGFGMGIHYCLGAPLARLEGDIAARTLAPRIKGLEIVDAGEGGVLQVGGAKSMTVRFELDPAFAVG